MKSPYLLSEHINLLASPEVQKMMSLRKPFQFNNVFDYSGSNECV